MSNMWSEKRYINYLINALLFLAAVNFMHYGQIFIALICLALFIDNNFKFKVNNIGIFIVLCIFAISFCAFSYKLGIYCIFGFFLPMAYYIGSNLKEVNEDSIKKVIYVIAFGMAFYIVLNLIYIISLYKGDLFNHLWDYDIWLRNKISPTTISTSMIFIISIYYFLIHYENKKSYRILGLLLFIFVLLFDLRLGRRAPILLTLLIYPFGLVIDILCYKNRIIKKKNATIVGTIILFAAVCFGVLLFFDINDFRFKMTELGLVKKFMNYGLDPERIEIFFESLKYMPTHLFGGQEISSILGIQIHDLWFDIYDYAGIIPFISMVLYTIYVIACNIKLIKKSNISNAFKLLVISFSVSIFLEMLIEPIMTGSSLLLICSIIVFACFEKLLN